MATRENGWRRDRRGERLVLAIERLAAALQAKGRALNLDTELKSLRDDVRPLDQFDAGRFASHLQALSQALAQRTR